MSTWISRRRSSALTGGLAVVAMLTLAGCAGGMPGPAGLFGFGHAPSQMEVAGGAVVIAGPSGYCIDRGGSRNAGGEAFVLLASCASITRDPKGERPLSPGLLTASVSAGGLEGMTPEVMRDFFATEAGRATLARDGQAGSVRLRETRVENGAVYMLVEDAGPGGVPGTEPLYWRGVAIVNGRIVTLAVLSFSDRPLSHDGGLATLRAFHRAVSEASSGRDRPPAAAGGEETRQSGLPGILGRLLR